MGEITELKILAPEPAEIKIGDKKYPIHKFVLAKAIRVFSMISKLSEDADLSSIVADIQDVGFATAIARGLPRVIAVAEPQIFNLMALILIPNRRIFEIIEKEENLDSEIRRVAKEIQLAEDLDIDKMFEIVQTGYERIGIDALKTNLAAMLEKVAPTEPATAPTKGPTPISG